MRKLIYIFLFASILSKGQDTVVHYKYWMKTKFDSIHAADSFPIKVPGLFDFQSMQLKDSTWFMPNSNIYNPFFKQVITNIQGSYLMDSIKIEPINDTMYINKQGPIIQNEQ